METYEDIYQESKSAGTLKNVSPVLFEFHKKGEALIGRFRGKKEVISKAYRTPFGVYTFDTDAGLVNAVFGASMDQNEGQLLEVGHIYRILFEGKVKLEGRSDMNTYVVEEIIVNEEEVVSEEGVMPF